MGSSLKPIKFQKGKKGVEIREKRKGKKAKSTNVVFVSYIQINKKKITTSIHLKQTSKQQTRPKTQQLSSRVQYWIPEILTTPC